MPLFARARPSLVVALLGGMVILGLAPKTPVPGRSPAAGRARPAERITPQYDSAFGYRVGEERRYVLEPERSLRSGEGAWWSIVLSSIQGEGDALRAVFSLEHQRREVIRDLFSGISGRPQVVDVTGELTVNRFGFPERLVMHEQSDVGGEMGSLSEVRTTVFHFDGERMVKQVRIDGREWSFDIAIASHDDLDFDIPVGLYAYEPSALRCLGVPGEAGRPFRCAGGDPAFANPGLLSLALPVMWEEEVNEKEFLFFTPTGVGTLPGGVMDMSRLMRRERDQIGNFTRYYDRTEIEVKEFVPGAEIGPRSVDAWKLDGSGEMREFFMRPDGTVLLVHIDPHPVTHGERWIRLLFPSEY